VTFRSWTIFLERLVQSLLAAGISVTGTKENVVHIGLNFVSTWNAHFAGVIWWGEVQFWGPVVLLMYDLKLSRRLNKMLLGRQPCQTVERNQRLGNCLCPHYQSSFDHLTRPTADILLVLLLVFLT